MSNDIPLTPAIKNFIRDQIEQELSYIVYPQHSPSLDLLKNILYYIAKSRGTTSDVGSTRFISFR